MESINEDTRPRNLGQFIKAFQNGEWQLAAQVDEAALSMLVVPPGVLDAAIGAYLDVPLVTHTARKLTEAQRAQQVAALRTHPRLVSAIEKAYRDGFRDFLKGIDHE